MNFREITQPKKPVTHLKAIAGTLQFQKKIYLAQKSIEKLMQLSKQPVVSCGGGKDSTAVALLARKVNPGICILCANPPNPLPDRGEHNQNLKSFLGGTWIDIDYLWNVSAVLSGAEEYPAGLKMKILKEFQADNEIDGIILGIRAAESKGRTINFRIRGDLYEVEKSWRSTPIVNFTAEESLAVALMCDAPINPVYSKTVLAPNYEWLRDGTWWCHSPQYADVCGGWIKHYYPDLYNDYMKSVEIAGKEKGLVCSY